MKKKPLSIKLIALAYLLAPIGNVLQIAYFNHWPLRGPRGVLNHFGAYEWCLLATFPVVALGIWRVARWGYFLFLLFATFLILQNTYIFLTNDAYGPYVAALFQLVTFGAVGFFLRKHIIAPYFNPKIRWWETSPRYKVQLVAHIRKEQSVMKGHLLDLSEGGCFLEVKKELALDDLVWLHMVYRDWHMTVQTRVVWVRKGDVPGYGLMFTSLEKVESKKLGWILKDLKKIQEDSGVQDHAKSGSILSA